MSKQSSKDLFEWYTEVAEQKLKDNYSHIKNYKDCKDKNEFKNWILLIYIKYYCLRCTCDDCMDFEFNTASSHYHHCKLYQFCHAINRSLEWSELQHKKIFNNISLKKHKIGRKNMDNNKCPNCGYDYYDEMQSP